LFADGAKIKIHSMKKASIVSIGNELISGQTLDTNAAYLSQKLLSLGVPVVSFYTVGDESPEIVRAFDSACSNADIVIATGGLGPTDDDITRQAFADFLEVGLVLHEDLLGQIEDFFARRQLRMPKINKIQAYIPAGADALPNSLGTAPGIMAIKQEKLFFVLPGVPSEMKQMFEDSVLPHLRRLTMKQAVVVKKLKCFGAGESVIAEMLGPIMQRGRNPLVNCTVEFGVVTLHIVASADNSTTAEDMAQHQERTLRDILGELVYGTGEQTLAQVVGEELTRQGKTLAVAESCTGGTVTKLLTDVPGASKYFTYGWVTYSDKAKITQLDVNDGLIEKNGAVSEQVAEAMARGARKKAQTDYAIAITGVAGPGGGTEQKPVGLVYISVDCLRGTDTQRYIFSHDRCFIRLRASQTALNMLRMKLRD
jgi:nicotinamide-nucleotide amidase